MTNLQIMTLFKSSQDVSTHSGKLICAAPRLSEIFPELLLKRFQSWSDWRPFPVLPRKISTATFFSASLLQAIDGEKNDEKEIRKQITADAPTQKQQLSQQDISILYLESALI